MNMMNNQIGMNNINMNMMNQMGMNNNMNMINQMGMNNNNINYFQNQIYNNDSIKIDEIDSKEKCLNYFFNFISFENKEKQNFKGTKLIINYYNIKNSYVYIDLNLKVGEIISKIYWQLFSSIFKKEVHKRTENNQTTEYIIKNPLYEIDNEDCPFQYSNFLYLEYNNKDMLISGDDTGEKLGLKEDSEIFLRIKKEFYDEIVKFPKIPISILFTTNRFTKEKEFPLNISGITLEKISKFFNNLNYSLTVNVDGYVKNVQTINENCDLSVGRKIIGGSGPPLNYVDIEKGNIRNLKFSEKAPKWRKVDKGLNIFGICNNSKCEASKKEVVYMTKLHKNGLIFNLNEKVADIRCPICNKIIKPKTCGFYDCEYQFIGKKIEDGDIKEYDSKTRETKGDNFEYFDPLENGEIVWTELNIYVLTKQKIKYLPN
jgi:hypothetical protein